MEEMSERQNLRETLQRVKDSKGSARVDRMTVDDLSAHPKEHWAVIWEQLLNGTYKPKPVKPDGGGFSSSAFQLCPTDSSSKQ